MGRRNSSPREALRRLQSERTLSRPAESYLQEVTLNALLRKRLGMIQSRYELRISLLSKTRYEETRLVHLIERGSHERWANWAHVSISDWGSRTQSWAAGTIQQAQHILDKSFNSGGKLRCRNKLVPRHSRAS